MVRGDWPTRSFYTPLDYPGRLGSSPVASARSNCLVKQAGASLSAYLLVYSVHTLFDDYVQQFCIESP